MAQQILPNLYYTNEHEWMKVEDNIATIGITDYAQHALGDVVFVELPAVGEQLVAGDAFGVVESIKSVSDLYGPISGEVIEKNGAVENQPDLCNTSPYHQAWMVKVRVSGMLPEKLMSAEQYRLYCADLAKN